MGELLGVTGKFISSNITLEKNLFYKIMGKNTTALISVGYRWDGVRSLYLVSNNENGDSARVNIVIENTNGNNGYIGQFFRDSDGNIYLKGRGSSFVAQLISFYGIVSLDKTEKAESELTLMNNNIVS